MKEKKVYNFTLDVKTAVRLSELELAIKQKDKIINSLLKSLHAFGYYAEINNNKDILTVEVRPEGV